MVHIKSFDELNEGILGFGANKEHDKVGNHVILVLYNLISKKYKNGLSYYVEYLDDKHIFVKRIGKDEYPNHPEQGFMLTVDGNNIYYKDYKQYIQDIYNQKYFPAYDNDYPNKTKLSLSREVKDKILKNLEILNKQPEREDINNRYKMTRGLNNLAAFKNIYKID